MNEILKFITDGYRGPLTDNQYLPPGEYTVGAELDIAGRIVTAEIAEYVAGIEKAVVTEYAPGQEHAPQAPAAPASPEGEPPFEAVPVVEMPPFEENEPESPLTADMLETLTVPILREMAEEYDIDVPASILKADLIDLILNA